MAARCADGSATNTTPQSYGTFSHLWASVAQDWARSIPSTWCRRFGVAAAHNGRHFTDQQRQAGQRVDRVETALELTYFAPITSWLSIQPDLQYVFNPNTDPRMPNALVGLIRIELAF